MNPPDAIATLNEVVGTNVRRIRLERGLTLDQVAREARKLGFRWNTARVIELEKGQLPVSLQMMLLLCRILQGDEWIDTTLTDLIRDAPREIRLSTVAAMSSGDLSNALRGRAVFPKDHATLQRRLARLNTVGEMVRARERKGEIEGKGLTIAGLTLADERAAKTLGLDFDRFIALAVRLWKHSLTEERDDRARTRSGNDASPPSAQMLGSITRELLDEMRAQLTELGNHDG
jgi:transcriptional regulator with XRE-family HTH domain